MDEEIDIDFERAQAALNAACDDVLVWMMESARQHNRRGQLQWVKDNLVIPEKLIGRVAVAKIYLNRVERNLGFDGDDLT